MSRLSSLVAALARSPVLAVAVVLSIASVASASPAVTATDFGITPADYVGAAVTVVGSWLGPALQAGVGLLAIFAGYKLIRRMITR